MARLTRIKRHPVVDPVDQAGMDSFPASDPSSHTVAIDPPAQPGDMKPLPEQELVEVHEHPVIDPACR